MDTKKMKEGEAMKRNPGCIESESQVCGKAVQSLYTSQPISLDLTEVLRQVQLLCPCNKPNYIIPVLPIPQEKVLASKMRLILLLYMFMCFLLEGNNLATKWRPLNFFLFGNFILC